MSHVRRVCAELLADPRRPPRRRMWIDDLAHNSAFEPRRGARRCYGSSPSVTLALGIGANTAALRRREMGPLDAPPHADASRLMRVYSVNEDRPARA